MSAETQAKKYIFLADDDADDRMLFEDALKEAPMQTELISAGDGVQLLNLLKKENAPQPEVIFLDLNMPRKNGFECLDEIRKTPSLKNIPVVIFSTTAQLEEVNKAYEKGANRYICKPGSFSLLSKAIQAVLAINWEGNTTPLTRENFLLQ